MEQPVEEIALFALSRSAGEWPRAEVLYQGQPVGLQVDGVLLEKQFRLAAGYLLFLTEDCPYEEGLHIYLLGPDIRLLDGLSLGGPYAAAMLQDVRVEDDASFTFSFFGADRWRLQVLARPQPAVSLSIFSPVKYQGGILARRRLRLRRLPPCTPDR